MIQQSGATAIVATADKFGAAAPHHVATLDEIDYLVIDQDVDAAMCAAFVAKSVSIVRAG
jgi:DeoR/GlpR family transcriptional regulator of sugar metabolism